MYNIPHIKASTAKQPARNNQALLPPSAGGSVNSLCPSSASCGNRLRKPSLAVAISKAAEESPSERRAFVRTISESIIRRDDTV